MTSGRWYYEARSLQGAYWTTCANRLRHGVSFRCKGQVAPTTDDCQEPDFCGDNELRILERSGVWAMKRSREERSLCAISTGRSVQVSIRYDTNFIAQRVATLSQKHSRHASHHCDSMCLVRTTRQLCGGEPQRRVLTSLRLTDMGGA